MAFDFFENGIASGFITNPNESIRRLQQASINAKWDATTAKYTVKEQDGFGLDTYHDIEVWIDYVVGMGSRGMTNGDDFRQLIFRDIEHPTKRGLYYQFDNNYWITYFTDDMASLEKDIGVRRCNNVLRIVDPLTGGIYSAPCVIDYDMSSPAQQVSTYVITPNNHATVMVQGNPDTIRLLKLDTRYILGGRPFKLLSFQNTLVDKSIKDYPTLLYLDLYLDEKQAKDDIENQIAYNGDYIYKVEINSSDLELTRNSTGSLKTKILFNGKEISDKKPIKWKSTNERVAIVDDFGNYIIKGVKGQSCKIIAYIDGNENSSGSIKVGVVGEDNLVPKILISPDFDKVRQYETIEFVVQVENGGTIIEPESVVSTNSKFLLIETKDGKHYITGNGISKKPQSIHIEVPEFSISEDVEISAVSMMG